jgi:peptidoglycan/LPS O-acetylase OafA/YrhL
MSHTRVIGLDIMRVAAALTVVIAHSGILVYGLWPEQEALWLIASWGMDLFFVLSGFLIGGILLRDARDGFDWIGVFWKRRWLRTLPNYYLFLFINALLWRATQDNWPDFRAHLLFVQNLAWPHPAFFPEAWSLAAVQVFYLVFALAFAILGLRQKRPWRSALVLLAALVLAHLLRWQQIAAFDMPWHEGVKKIVLARGDAMLYGVLAALWMSVLPPGKLLSRALLLVAPLPLLLAAWLYLQADANLSLSARLWCFTLSGVSFALMLPACSQYQGTAMPTALRTSIQRLAMWSFALYLAHLPAIRVLTELLALPRSTWAQALSLVAVYLVLSVATAAIVYRYFEEPILAWRDRRIPANPNP